ncbi:P-loop containing nucleoside triphosphatehydrolases superfamily protein [Striga asiatica]|uniref:P-loop containing nucleoside triphosphatehydrolases superfamily protein n=1 Tax=Striga asiatica TaxID=4170 RepID=A0A5A7PZ51_STRAF|nr:P-loop containing nucleoside triphosphatehydrolases superfamily protein [Striga asiatica]
MGSEANACNKFEKNSISELAERVNNNNVVVVPCTPPPNYRSTCSVVPPTPEDTNEFSIHSRSSETPTDALFDSFAPGPDKLMLAPQPPMKYRQESRTHVVRSLNFADFLQDTLGHESNTDEKSIECFLEEIVYSTVMDAIVSEQQTTKQVEVEVEVHTPESAPRLIGIAETCPKAPFKYVCKKRSIVINKEICKKLDF